MHRADGPQEVMMFENEMMRWIRALCVAAALVGGSAQGVLAQAPADGEADTQVQVDLNHATEVELTTLPGVGPSRARAIIAFRERRPFRRVEEVMRVRGIGRATFRQIRSMLTVTPAANATMR